MTESVFQFRPEWKERLVVTGPGGAFELDLPMGVLSVNLPSAATWAETAPDWAQALWPVLHAELTQWCLDHHADLYASHSHGVRWL